MINEAYKSDIMWKRSLEVSKKMEEKNLSAEAALINISRIVVPINKTIIKYEVPENEIWLFDEIVTGDIVPGVFEATIKIDDRPLFEKEQLLSINSIIQIPTTLIAVRDIIIDIENLTIINQDFEMIFIYTIYSKKILATLLGELGINIPRGIKP